MIGLDTLHHDRTQWRHDPHRPPGFGFKEKRIAVFMAKTLCGFGIEVAEGICDTDVVGTLERGTSNRTIALRITEASGRDYASTNPGTMHASDHDGHPNCCLGRRSCSPLMAASSLPCASFYSRP